MHASVIDAVKMNTFTRWIHNADQRSEGVMEPMRLLNDSIEKNLLWWTKSVNEVQRFSGEKQGSQIKSKGS